MKKIAFSIVAVSITFVLLNIIAWIIEPKHSVFWDNPLMMMYPVGDFDLSITAQQYNRNDDPNRLVRYVSDKKRWYKLDPEPIIPAHGKLVLHFGDSSTWGWGLTNRENAYPGALKQFVPTGTHSINLGVPGYSSLQGLKHVEEIVSRHYQRIDGITIYFGNNDATENGATDDKKLVETNTRYRLLLHKMPLSRILLEKTSSLHQHDHRQPRVNPDEYGQNLRRMIAIAQMYNIPVVAIKPPVHLSWPPGHLTHTVSLASLLKNPWSQNELAQAQTFYQKGLRLIGKNDGYENWLVKSLNHDWVVPRLKTAWSEMLIRTTISTKTTLIVIPRPFVEAEYPYSFVDYCHPSVRTHQLLAEQIAHKLGYSI